MKKKMSMKKKPGMASHADAQVVIRLYELRREPEMRKAREYMTGAFWPQTLEDLTKVSTAFGTDENRYFRMVTSYWEMASALVLRGAVDSGVFNDWASEMYFLYAKLLPILPEIRGKGGMPRFLHNTDKVVHFSAESRTKLEMFVQNVNGLRQRFAGAAKK
jgi:hypothetical protein